MQEKVSYRKSGVLNNVDLYSFLLKKALPNITIGKACNLGRNILETFNNIPFRRPLPYFMLVDTINQCDMLCPGCFVRQAGLESHCTEQLRVTDFEKMIKKLSHGLVYVMFGCLYEPTLSPDIYRMIDMCRSHGVLPFITTNLLNTDIDSLIESDVPYVQVSLSGGDEHIFEKTTGVKGFQQVIDNLSILCNKRKRSDMFIHVKTVMNRYSQNMENIVRIRDILADIGVDKYSLKRFQPIFGTDGLEEILPDPGFIQAECGYTNLTQTKRHRGVSMLYMGPDGSISQNETTYTMAKLKGYSEAVIADLHKEIAMHTLWSDEKLLRKLK